MPKDPTPVPGQTPSRSLMSIMQRGFSQSKRRRAPVASLGSSLESLENRTVPNTGILAGVDPMMAYAFAPAGAYGPAEVPPIPAAPPTYAMPPLAMPPLGMYLPEIAAPAPVFPAMAMPTPPLAFPPSAMLPEAFAGTYFGPEMAPAIPMAPLAAAPVDPPLAAPAPISPIPAMVNWTGNIPADPPVAPPLAGGAGSLASSSIDPPSFPGMPGPAEGMGGGGPAAAPPMAAPAPAPMPELAPGDPAYAAAPTYAAPPPAPMPPLADPVPVYAAPTPAYGVPVAPPLPVAAPPVYTAPPLPEDYLSPPPAYEAPPAAAPSSDPLPGTLPEDYVGFDPFAPPAAPVPNDAPPEPAYGTPIPPPASIPPVYVAPPPAYAPPADAAPPAYVAPPSYYPPLAAAPPAADPYYSAPPANDPYAPGTDPGQFPIGAIPPLPIPYPVGPAAPLGGLPEDWIPVDPNLVAPPPATPPLAHPPADPVPPPSAGTPSTPAPTQKPNNANDVPLDYDAAVLWHVILKPGEKIETLAAQYGISEYTPSGRIENSYLFQRPSGTPGAQLAASLRADAKVDYYEMLIAKQQTSRAVPNDPLYDNQWHLYNSGQFLGTAGEDINVQSVWDNYRGNGATIGIVDDGLQGTHPDLAANYLANYSYDFNDDDNDPTPSAGASHGTASAGVAAAVGFNGIGLTGVAPEAGLAGIRLIAAPTTDLQEANALTYQYNNIDIYNNSWGPSDDGDIDPMGRLVRAALEEGVTEGRGGLGNIYVWAGGNGAQSSDNVNYDGYANSRFVIAVGAIDNNGERSVYSEPGAALFVVAPSSFTDSSGNSPGTWTTYPVGTGNQSNDYTSDFNGTSSAAPVVSGVVALMLEANPDLTWRDVKHILARTARVNDPTNSDWTTNGAGFNINHEYGFGVVDAAAAVALAETWVNVGPEVQGGSELIAVNQLLVDPDPDDEDEDLVTESIPVVSTVRVRDDITVETVEVTVNIATSFRGDLSIKLVSPSGTVSVLAEPRLEDSGANYDSWTFTTVRNWGENSQGNWSLVVEDVLDDDLAFFDSWQINVYGTGTVAPPIPPGWATVLGNT